MVLNGAFVQREPTRQTTVNFSEELWFEAKKNIIPLKDAMEFGIKFILADKESESYDYPACNLIAKLQRISKSLSEISQKYYALKEKYEPEEKSEEEVSTKSPEEEADEIFENAKGN